MELLELDIDIRIASIISHVLEQQWWQSEEILWWLRLAYSTGYHDSLVEKRRGQLMRDHGFSVPRRRR